MAEEKELPTRIKVERAGIADLEFLMAWRERVLRSVFELSEDADIALLMQRNRSYYEKSLADGTQRACFAFMDSQRVGCGGMCLHSEIPSPDNPSGACAYLMNIYTTPDARGQGVALTVVNWLVNQAQASGAEKIYLEATPAGRRVYEKAGFANMPHMMIFGRPENSD